MVDVHKFESVGDWEVLYVDGESVKQNHIGRVDVVSYLEDTKVDDVVSTRVNLPQGETRFPDTLEEVIERDDFDFNGDDS